ncbi:hypothetical protein BDZ89DRAFT_1074898, partial [Hymenopellis radicata]
MMLASSRFTLHRLGDGWATDWKVKSLLCARSTSPVWDRVPCASPQALLQYTKPPVLWRQGSCVHWQAG